MKKRKQKKSLVVPIFLAVLSVIIVGFIVIPLFSSFINYEAENVALISVEGTITGNGASYLGSSTISSKDIVRFIESAAENEQIEVILIEINSPGGSAVATDEIATAIKRTKKPTVSLIREAGASGGYWVASATDHIIANKMSITGSIGVLSSYMEFSDLMDKYGISYQRLVAGDKKDVGTPFKKLTEDEEKYLQGKINKIHDYFIEEIANNRNLEKSQVEKLATGEIFLGVEALDLGLIDQLGDKEIAKEYIQETYGLEEVNFLVYQKEVGLLDVLSQVFTDLSFNLGKGIGAILLENNNGLMLI
ncbi:signal peptide peptidase SppA [Candidatus Woesearchaeota archaeon]|jgi:protease IV|nr:signal peptide peptidase SppA [Candidatus Woesearchaeota archaeon]MBT4111438.1 signal peptide peptidase SppA [Candidatus Woesearchaeota archaeon]MBT4336367.1 signal peptide peptidase SppA [Candidatus Woesearchaeota archaeon]MBT4469978.1 signal peptide peptidase SppA [Candidatus Woesearchaeota archaeon]MBT6744298.1 signal peptide peptidase SppA [Candidatus Woesearchaeota archaeon]